MRLAFAVVLVALAASSYAAGKGNAGKDLANLTKELKKDDATVMDADYVVEQLEYAKKNSDHILQEVADLAVQYDNPQNQWNDARDALNEAKEQLNEPYMRLRNRMNQLIILKNKVVGDYEMMGGFDTRLQACQDRININVKEIALSKAKAYLSMYDPRHMVRYEDALRIGQTWSEFNWSMWWPNIVDSVRKDKIEFVCSCKSGYPQERADQIRNTYESQSAELSSLASKLIGIYANTIENIPQE